MIINNTVYVVHAHSVGWTRMEGIYDSLILAKAARNRVQGTGDNATVEAVKVQTRQFDPAIFDESEGE